MQRNDIIKMNTYMLIIIRKKSYCKFFYSELKGYIFVEKKRINDTRLIHEKNGFAGK